MDIPNKSCQSYESIPKPGQMRQLSKILVGAEMALQESNPPFAAILGQAALFLEEASRNCCGQGYFGCHGGDECGSDHK